MKGSVNVVVLLLLSAITFIADVLCVRLIREEGFRKDSYFYHQGDNGYAYHYSFSRQYSIYFKCIVYDQGCRGRAILRLGQGFEESKPHDHPPNRDLIQAREFRRVVLKNCAKQRWVSYKDILDAERSNNRYHRRVRSKMTLSRLRTSMRAARMKTYPDIPQTLKDLTKTLTKRKYRHISATLDKEDNLYAGSVTALDGSHNVVFISARMREFMSDVKIIHADGTFRARPAVPASSQLFVMVTTWRHTIIPLCWVLMERRTEQAYRAVFKFLKEVMPDFSPSRVITDFEYPQQSAWQKEFPGAKIQGCLWHLCRAFLKKCKDLKLKKWFKVLPSMLPTIRQACVISLLPTRYFQRGLEIIRTETRRKDIVTAYLLEPFFQYINNRWINSRFRSRWMAFYNSPYRTNNACESSHRALRNATGAHRPNIYAFIEALGRIENNASLDISVLTDGGIPSRSRRWTAVANDKSLKRLSSDFRRRVYRNRRTAIKNYLQRAAHTMHRAVDIFAGV